MRLQKANKESQERKSQKESKLESDFLIVWKWLANTAPPESEVRFHPERRWRFDFAFIEQKIAIELEGGIWIGGRHQTGKGFQGDCEKYNQATILGWRVLRYTADDINQRPVQIIEEIQLLQAASGPSKSTPDKK